MNKKRVEMEVCYSIKFESVAPGQKLHCQGNYFKMKVYTVCYLISPDIPASGGNKELKPPAADPLSLRDIHRAPSCRETATK